MESRDKYLLQIQFRNKVYRKNATEFQTFFEDIMERACPDFRKIRPYGSIGDAGNDGYRPSEGIYYQVYAPKDPDEKEAAAAKKLKEDFEKLKKNWNRISEIKTYNFVFNDKGYGSTIDIEQALSDLRQGNPSIDFKLIISKDLEQIFLNLKQDDILALGFSTDETKSINIANEYFRKLEVDLDRENAKSVLEALHRVEDIFLGLGNEELQLNYEILEGRTFLKLERANEAKDKFENLSKRYSDDP